VPARGGTEVALGIWGLYYKAFLIYRTCMRRAAATPVRACFVRTCCTVVVQEHDLRRTPAQCNSKRHFLHTSHCTLHTPHITLHTCTSSHLKSCEFFSLYLGSSHLIPSLLTCHLSKFFSIVFISSEHWSTFLISSKFFSTHLSCSARQKALTVREKSLAQKTLGHRKLLHTEAWDTNALTQKSLYKISCTTKLAQTTSQYYFVLQSLHKVLPSTSLYYKACAEYSPVLLCTTKLAPNTSQYIFVPQSLHKALPSTTLYYKACTKHFPVPLCTTSQYSTSL